MHDGSIVFRTYRVTFTEEDLRTGIAQAEYQVVVEVDQVDPEAHEGWVVLVRGTAHHVDTEAERASISTTEGSPRWANVSSTVTRISLRRRRVKPAGGRVSIPPRTGRPSRVHFAKPPSSTATASCPR